MSGIAAIINLNQQPVERSQIEVITRAVSHRGRDAEQYFYDKNIALGHRLNKLYSEDNTSQPFDNEYITVLIDGEIFNRKEILNNLQIKTDISDSEIIARAYQRWQLDFLEHLDGKWAIVIYDKKTERILAIRDRFAFKPLYFAFINDQFCLASEIKQFTYLNGWTAKLNTASARDFLAFGHQDHTNDTFFEGIKQLLMGEYLCFDLKTKAVDIKNYYDLKKYTPQYMPFEEAKNKYQEIISEGINRHLISGQRYGTMLSGGLDSTIVACVLNNLIKEKKDISIEALSLVLKERSPLDETIYIDHVRDFTQLSVQKVVPDFAVFQQSLDEFVYFQDEPVYTDSAFAQYSVFKRASELGIRQIFGGTGADAALAGYTKYILIYLQQLRHENPLKTLTELAGFLKYNGGWAIQHWIKKQRTSQNGMTDWLNPMFIDTTQQGHFNKQPSLYEYSLEVYLSDATVALHYDDRSAAAFGIESYFPMYDKKFVELSLQLQDDYKIKNGKQKYILREAFKDIIPSKIYNRYDKKGFYNPGEIWMQQHPDWWVNEMRTIIMDNPRIFNPKLLTIFENFARHNKLNVNEGVFWRVFFFGKWQQRFNVSY